MKHLKELREVFGKDCVFQSCFDKRCLAFPYSKLAIRYGAKNIAAVGYEARYDKPLDTLLEDELKSLGYTTVCLWYGSPNTCERIVKQ